VSTLLISFPLPSHRFARPAAMAAMCALEQDRFVEFQDAVFARQDSLGLKPWNSYAIDAGIADTARFGVCIASGRSHTLVDRGLIVGDSLGVKVTPTVLINGYRYSTPPLDSLGSIIDQALNGRRPH